MRHERVPVTLKDGPVAWAADLDGGLRGGDHGLYAHDARWLRRFAWAWPDDLIELRIDARGPQRVRQRLARIEGVDALGQRSPREALAVRRTLTVHGDGADEELVFEAWNEADATVEARLEIDAFVQDVFEVRGFADVGPRERRVRTEPDSDSRSVLEIDHVAPDGVIDRLRIRVEADDGLRVEMRETAFDVAGVVPAGQTRGLRAWVGIQRLAPTRPSDSGRDASPVPPARLTDVGSGTVPPPLPEPDAWSERVVPRSRRGVLAAQDDGLALDAAADLRALLLPTAFGPVPAAGVPWYVAPFGRDALLSCLMVPEADDALAATLRLFAALQGRRDDPARAEAPGKIAHEMRVGAATRTGTAPFGPHYGTVDATPLWIAALGRAVDAGDVALLRDLEAPFRRALGWLRTASDDDALLRFASGEGGYAVQSWKDAGDSMTHRDGRLARGRLAVVEVQGYAEWAWRSAAGLLDRLGQPDDAHEARERAATLRRALDERFFRADLGRAGCYALALDEAGAPLEVVSSDPGHLLWTGSVPRERARDVARSLLADTAWSGWGVRTLAADEVRYAAVSYHCGSVWPHDTALFALGLERYGLTDEAARVARAVLDLTARRSDERAPELIAGDARDDGPPASYPDACRLQAWSAAAVVAMHALLVRVEREA